MANPLVILLALSGASAAANMIKYKQFLNDFKKGEVKSKDKLSYLSLFSGIGGFELGINKVFPNAECISFSEIDPVKIQVYEKHFPNHKNLGDVSEIPTKQLSKLKADLLVGGFSCKSKSALSAIGRKGKSDISTDTFDYTLNVLRYGKFKDVILENVPTAHTSTLTTEEIIKKLEIVLNKKVYHTVINACSFTGTSRKRVFFTTFEIKIPIPEISKSFDFILDPFSQVMNGFIEEIPDGINYWAPETESDRSRPLPKDYLTPFAYKKALNEFMNISTRPGFNRWSFISDTNKKCSATLIKKSGTYPSGLIIDRRGGQPLVRYMTVNEAERLMGFPVGWTSIHSKTKAFQCLGDAVVVDVIQFVMLNYLYHYGPKKFSTYKPYK